jgi:hypothetical protein
MILEAAAEKSAGAIPAALGKYRFKRACQQASTEAGGDSTRNSVP